MAALLTQTHPTVRSVATAAGLTSLSVTWDHLGALRAAGLVTWEPYRKGTLRTTLEVVQAF